MNYSTDMRHDHWTGTFVYWSGIAVRHFLLEQYCTYHFAFDTEKIERICSIVADLCRVCYKFECGIFSRHHFTTRWTELKNKHTHETDSATWKKNTQHKNGRPIFLPYFREEIVISRKHDTEQLVLINYAMSGFNF